MFMLAEGNNANSPISGDDIFINDSNNTFTRSGNFYLDQEGYIVNSSGKYLVGSSAEAPDGFARLQIPDNAKSFSISSDGSVNYIDSTGSQVTAGSIKLAKFSNPSGLNKVGGNEFEMTENAGLTGPVEGDNVDGIINALYTPGQNGAASVVSGALEMSNVDLSEEFTEMITAQRGFQANTRIITTSDEILQELVNLKR